ncbi:MAG: maleate isomerase [Granulosicoccus sp.]|jgi:maleate isomerase
MEHLSFELKADDATSPAVGLVVLQSDETMEHELRHWLADSIRLFHTRIPNEVEISQDSLHRMKAALPAATSLLPSTTDFKVIVYGCTSGTTVIGEQAVADAVRSVFPGVKVTNPLSAIKAQLLAMEAKRIALLTPYVPDVSKALIDELESAGIEVVRGASFHESRDDRVARISPESLQSAIESLGTPRDIDAIVASCTNLRTFDILDDVSTKVGIPVISSNSALVWHIKQLLAASKR